MEKEKSADLKSAVVDIIRMAESTSAKFDVVMYEYFATCKCPHRGAVEAVVLHWLRNKTLIESAILAACRKRPKNAVFAVLKGAAAEAMSAESEKYAQTIHSWVEFSKRKLSKNESSFINAVLRKLETNIATLESGGDGAEHLSIKYSHPKWLVEKWLGEFGSDTTLRILESNQRPSDVFFRKSPDPKADAAFVPFEKFFEKNGIRKFLQAEKRALARRKASARNSVLLCTGPIDVFCAVAVRPERRRLPRPLRRSGGKVPRDCRHMFCEFRRRKKVLARER